MPRPVRIVQVVAVVCLTSMLLATAASVGSLQDDHPGVDDLPALSEGYTYAEVEEGCGSGGCFVTAEVSGPDGTGAEQILKSPDVRGCEANGWVDRRSRCTELEVSDRGVTISVMVRDLGK